MFYHHQQIYTFTESCWNNNSTWNPLPCISIDWAGLNSIQDVILAHIASIIIIFFIIFIIFYFEIVLIISKIRLGQPQNIRLMQFPFLMIVLPSYFFRYLYLVTNIEYISLIFWWWGPPPDKTLRLPPSISSELIILFTYEKKKTNNNFLNSNLKEQSLLNTILEVQSTILSLIGFSWFFFIFNKDKDNILIYDKIRLFFYTL